MTRIIDIDRFAVTGKIGSHGYHAEFVDPVTVSCEWCDTVEKERKLAWEWMEANGIDPHKVPTEQYFIVDDERNVIRYLEFVYEDRDGRPQKVIRQNAPLLCLVEVSLQVDPDWIARDVMVRADH